MKHLISLKKSKTNLRNLFIHVKWDERTLDGALTFGRQRQREITERIERDRYSRTFRTVHRGPEQAVQGVDDDAVVTFPVILPRLIGDIGHGAAFDLFYLDVPTEEGRNN